jgi:hypothetical protein
MGATQLPEALLIISQGLLLLMLPLFLLLLLLLLLAPWVFR